MLDRIADLFADSARPVLNEIRGMLTRLERGAVLLAIMTALALAATIAIFALVAAAVVALTPLLGVAGALASCAAFLLGVSLIAGLVTWRAIAASPKKTRQDTAEAAAESAESKSAGSPNPPPDAPMKTPAQSSGERKQESFTDPAVLAAGLAAAVVIFGPTRIARAAATTLDSLKLAGTLLAGADLLASVQSIASVLSSMSKPSEASADGPPPAPDRSRRLRPQARQRSRRRLTPAHRSVAQHIAKHRLRANPLVDPAHFSPPQTQASTRSRSKSHPGRSSYPRSDEALPVAAPAIPHPLPRSCLTSSHRASQEFSAMERANVFLACLALGAFSMSAVAQDAARPAAPREGGQRQPGGGGQRGNAMSAEKSKAAWEAQATAVAKRLNLNADQTKELVAAYTASRESYNAEATKAREEAMKKAQEQREKDGNNNDQGGNRRGGGGMAEMAKAMEEVSKKEREKFEKAIPSSLSGDQRSKAVATLGHFSPSSRQWDTLTSTIVDMKLEGDKQQKALESVETYFGTLAKITPANPADAGDTDREKLRTERQAALKTLTDSLKPILSEEQLKKIEDSTRMGGRGGAGGPGGERPGNGGGENGGRRPARDSEKK